jgi:hypothetical protein
MNCQRQINTKMRACTQILRICARVHDSRDEKFNLCKKDGNPKPAFFELNLDA